MYTDFVYLSVKCVNLPGIKKLFYVCINCNIELVKSKTISYKKLSIIFRWPGLGDREAPSSQIFT